MAAYDGPSQGELLESLKKLVQGGMDPEWILNNGDLFLGLAAVVDRTAGKADPIDDDVDAAQDPRVVAFNKVMDEAIKQLAPRETRRLLRSILGIYKETRGLKLGQRRAKAGAHFRGEANKVSGGTVRSHYEPPALQKLSWILVKMEAAQRGQQLPETGATDS